MFSSVSTLRFELALMLPKSPDESLNILSVALVCILLTGCISGILSYFLGEYLLGSSFYKMLKTFLWIIPAYVILNGLFVTLMAWFSRYELFSIYSLAQFAMPTATAIFQVSLYFLGFKDDSGLFLGTIIGQTLVCLFLVILFIFRYHAEFRSSVCPRKMWLQFTNYSTYPLHMTPYTLLGCLRERVIYFLIGQVGTVADVGFYGLSSRLINAPVSLISASIRPVFFSNAATRGIQSTLPWVMKTQRLLVVIFVPLWIFFLFNYEDLFKFVFGDNWSGAGIYAAIISLYSLPLLIGNWLDRAFDIIGRQKTVFLLEAISSVFTIGVMALSLTITHKPLVGVFAQSLALTAYYCLWLFLLFRLLDIGHDGLIGLIFIFLSVAFPLILFFSISSFLFSSFKIMFAVQVIITFTSILLGVF